MANAAASIAARIPAQNVTRRQGIITGTPTSLAVNVDGNTIPFRCIDPLTVGVGDTVAVDLVTMGATGQAEAWVIGRLSAGFRPGSGTVKTVPPSSPSITVTGTDGTDYTAYFITSYTPTVGDNVELSWAASVPYVMGKVGTTAAPAAPPAQPVAAPPPPVQSDHTYYAATDSGTWTPTYGAWDVWAGGGGHVYQGGSDYGAANYGSWFYGGSPMELAGRTITRVQFHTPTRRTIGSYNSTVTAHFYSHTSQYKPGGDVGRNNGPYDVLVLPGWGGGWIDLPVAWGATLAGGGGISIAGEPYMGFFGRNYQPDSGNLLIDWTR